jgi:polar amino acid transport system permease protein
MELLIVAAIWYLAVVSVLSIGQYFLEKHFARGQRGNRANQNAEEARA